MVVRDLMNGSSNKAISPVVLGLLLVVLVVTGAILGYVFLIGAQEGFKTNPTGINSTILSSLYSTEAKVGVNGDTGNFTISLSNTQNVPQRVEIDITKNGHQVQNSSFRLLASQTTTVILSLPLNGTGIWVVKVTSRGLTSNSYAFQVMGTKDEADFAAAQWRDQNFYRNLVLAGFIIAIIAFIVSAASLARKPKTVIQ